MSNVRFLTTREVADALQTTTREVARRVERGDLVPVTKLPGLRGAFLFDPKVVEEQSA